jgi:uncharacterized spore protein YtfJ
MTMLQEIIDKARDVMTVQRVYGEPYEKDGVTLIPAAAVRGGGGGGRGTDDKGVGGDGGGFGVTARPVGAYVIDHGAVDWKPALDLNRVILGGQVVVVVALLVLRGVLKRMSKRAA